MYHKNTFFKTKISPTRQASAWGLVWRNPKGWLEDPLKIVEIKNPFGFLQTNPQADAWWVGLYWFLKKVFLVVHPSTHTQCVLHIHIQHIHWIQSLWLANILDIYHLHRFEVQIDMPESSCAIHRPAKFAANSWKSNQNVVMWRIKPEYIYMTNQTKMYSNDKFTQQIKLKCT